MKFVVWFRFFFSDDWVRDLSGKAERKRDERPGSVFFSFWPEGEEWGGRVWISRPEGETFCERSWVTILRGWFFRAEPGERAVDERLGGFIGVEARVTAGRWIGTLNRCWVSANG